MHMYTWKDDSFQVTYCLHEEIKNKHIQNFLCIWYLRGIFRYHKYIYMLNSHLSYQQSFKKTVDFADMCKDMITCICPTCSFVYTKSIIIGAIISTYVLLIGYFPV